MKVNTGIIGGGGVDLGVVVDFLSQYNAEVWVLDVELPSEYEKV
jgi:hypothetical protein